MSPPTMDASSLTSEHKSIDVHFTSKDPVVITQFGSNPYNGVNSTRNQITLGNLEQIAQTEGISGSYIVDLHGIASKNYADFAAITHRLVAIKPSTRVAFFATKEQQDSKLFDPIGRLSESSRAIVYTRPQAPSSREVIPEDYVVAIKDLDTNDLREVNQPFPRNGKLEEATVIKIGGSIFDLFKEQSEGLTNLLTAVVEAHSQGNRLVLNVGGGPSSSINKEMGAALNLSTQTREEHLRLALEATATTIEGLLYKIKKNLGTILDPELAGTIIKGGYLTRDYLDNHIPIIYLLPKDSEAIGLPKNIPRDFSDPHSIYLAECLGARKIIFAKNTEGIYARDPNMTRELLKTLGLPKENPFMRFIYADEVESKIDRRGVEPSKDVTPDHLIETAALLPFMQSKSPFTVQIVNGTKPQELRAALDGRLTGSYILKP